jgi:hypothetical protein
VVGPCRKSSKASANLSHSIFSVFSTNGRRQVKKVQRVRKGSDLDFRNAPALWARAAKIEI